MRHAKAMVRNLRGRPAVWVMASLPVLLIGTTLSTMFIADAQVRTGFILAMLALMPVIALTSGMVALKKGSLKLEAGVVIALGLALSLKVTQMIVRMAFPS